MSPMQSGSGYHARYEYFFVIVLGLVLGGGYRGITPHSIRPFSIRFPETWRPSPTLHTPRSHVFGASDHVVATGDSVQRGAARLTP